MTTTAAPPLAVRPRAIHREQRCSYCHAALEDRIVACGGCGTLMHVSCSREWANCPTLGCTALDLAELPTLRKRQVRWVSHRRPLKPCWGVFYATTAFALLIVVLAVLSRL